MNKNNELHPWKITKSELLLNRDPWLRVYGDEVLLPDGRIIDEYLRLVTKGYAMIVPVNDHEEIGLVRSFKKGVADFDLQPPAGVLEDDETALETAKRELLEELGCEANTWHPLGKYTISGNYGAGLVHFFLATGAHQVQRPDSGDLEEQEVVWMPIEQLRSMWARGELRQLGSIAALGLAFAALDDSTPELNTR